MEWLTWLSDVFLHLDKHLADVVSNYGVWTYLILFVIIFCETGLVVTPFLPGDSLLFAAGSIAALGSLDPVVALPAAERGGHRRRHGQLLDRGLHRPAGLQRRDPLPEEGASRPHPRLLREVRRQDDHHRPLRPDCPHVRPLRGRHRGDELRQVHRLQRRRRGGLGGAVRLRRLLVRNAAVRQEKLLLGRPGDHRHLGDADGRRVSAGAAASNHRGDICLPQVRTLLWQTRMSAPLWRIEIRSAITPPVGTASEVEGASQRSAAAATASSVPSSPFPRRAAAPA